MNQNSTAARALDPPPTEDQLCSSILAMLRDQASQDPGQPVRAWGLGAELNIPQHMLFRLIEVLERQGLIEYHGAGPLVSVTPFGQRYLESAGDEEASQKNG